MPFAVKSRAVSMMNVFLSYSLKFMRLSSLSRLKTRCVVRTARPPKSEHCNINIDNAVLATSVGRLRKIACGPSVPFESFTVVQCYQPALAIDAKREGVMYRFAAVIFADFIATVL